MKSTQAIRHFHGNWFARHEEALELTEAEADFINAALGEEAKRWDGEPNTARLGTIIAEHPDVCDRIGPRLLKVAVGMRGCGDAVAFLLRARRAVGRRPHGLHRAPRGRMGRSGRHAASGLRVRRLGRHAGVREETAHRLARQRLADVLGGLGRLSRPREAPDPIRRRAAPRASDQRQRRARHHVLARSRRAQSVGGRQHERSARPSSRSPASSSTTAPNTTSTPPAP